MKVERSKVFETNSSSIHSFTTWDKPEYSTINPNDAWEITIYFWEFWWEQDSYSSPQSLASYIATHLFWNEEDKNIDENWEYKWDDSRILAFENAIMEHTWATKILYSVDRWACYPCWYIDHQSSDVAEDMCDNFKDSIFWWGYLSTDNDNH